MNFEQALRLSGLIPGEIVDDGRRRRCRTEAKPHHKNGQYALLPGAEKGFWRDFAMSSEWHVWTTDNPRPLTVAERARNEQRIAKLREDERRRTMRGVMMARQRWASGSPFRGHPYLSGKRLSPEGASQLRTWRGEVWTSDGPVVDDWLLVPMFKRGSMLNVQQIGTGGLKRQIKDAPQIGCTYTIERKGSAVTVLVEGLATGLAAYQCVRCASVVVTFYADNLLPVIQDLKPRGQVVIAADNDWATALKPGPHFGINPGREKACNAADLIDCGVAWPEGIQGSDWADAWNEWGPTASKRIERLILSKAKYVVER